MNCEADFSNTPIDRVRGTIFFSYYFFITFNGARARLDQLRKVKVLRSDRSFSWRGSMQRLAMEPMVGCSGDVPGGGAGGFLGRSDVLDNEIQANGYF